MGTFTLTHNTPATPDAVWEVLDDFGSVATWSTGVASANITNGIARGVGAERHCQFDAAGKQWVKERIVERGADFVVIHVYDTNAPLSHLEARIEVQAAGAGSRVAMTMSLKVKGGPFGALMEVALVRPSFKKAVRTLLHDLDGAAQNLVAA